MDFVPCEMCKTKLLYDIVANKFRELIASTEFILYRDVVIADGKSVGKGYFDFY